MENPVGTRPEFYAQRVEQHRAVCQRLARKSRWLSNLRGLCFATSILAWGFSLFGSAGAAGALLGTAALVAFLGLVVYHSRVIDAENTEARWVNTNQDARARVTVDGWHRLEFDGSQFRDPSHPYSDDLDLFGPASLYQRLCVAKISAGQTKLADWLKAPSAPSLLRERQRLVAQLAPQLDLRQSFEVLARATLPTRVGSQAAAAPNDLEPLFSWGEAAAAASSSPWLKPAARVLPILTSVLFGLAYWGVVPGWLGVASLFGHLF